MGDSDLELGYIFLACVILACALYFLTIEMLQFKAAGWGYWLSPWNYIDILPPVL
jgi:hypothetical protein